MSERRLPLGMILVSAAVLAAGVAATSMGAAHVPWAWVQLASVTGLGAWAGFS